MKCKGFEIKKNGFGEYSANLHGKTVHDYSLKEVKKLIKWIVEGAENEEMDERDHPDYLENPNLCNIDISEFHPIDRPYIK